MTALAVCLISEPSSLCLRYTTPTHILSMGHRFQVIWVNACSITTEVIQLQSLRDWTLVELVGEAVC